MAKGRNQPPTQGRRRRDPRSIYILGAALALGVVGLVILLSAVSRGGDGGTIGDPVIVPTSRPAAVARNGTVYGDPNATVAVTEYLDFQCPICLRAGLTVLTEIERQYVESGKATFEARPIAILGNESVDAAEAAQCANEQGHFWEYHDILYANQAGENKGTFAIANLKRFAEALGLDTGAFNSCLDSNKYESQVKQDTDSSKGQGVTGTPTVFVDGQKVETSVDAIKAAIETALAAGS